jgi:hypothetical protein
VTVIDAPPRPQPSPQELEALIEEARRRARRRRLLLGGGVVAVLGAAGLAVGLVLASRGGKGTPLPRGYHLVRAGGPVQHALLEDLRHTSTTIDVASGKARATRVTQEIWWDGRSGFARTVYWQDGRRRADWVEQQCQGTGKQRFCIPPSPFDLQNKGFGLPPRPNFARRAGTGTFRGHRVVWIEGLVQPGNAKPYPGGDQVAYDVATHLPVALRSITRGGRFDGRTFSFYALTMLPDAKGVSFVVPDGGAGRNAPSEATFVTGQGLPAARAALGTTPLWLGRSFRGHRLVSVVTGKVGIESQFSGRMLRPARFARFDYGSFSIQEFGEDRPAYYEHDPLPGTVVVGTGPLAFARDGVLVTVVVNGPKFDLDPRTALALVRALRPVER